ncbi:hypothetical protein FBY12_0558 [Pseudomonas sp. SJZ131]|nr:hypothetical protein FBY12_0558 [Pseudomonas sp. SJZ131]
MRPEQTPHNGHREQARSHKGIGLFTQPMGNTKPMWEPSLLAMRPELTPHNGHREQAHSYKGIGLFTRPLGNTQTLWE